MDLKKLNTKTWKQKALFLYKINKMSDIKEKCVCPVCGESFIKKYYQQVFHSIECKDVFHNLIDTKRLNRMKDYRGYTK